MGWTKRNGVWQLHREPNCLACYDGDFVQLVVSNVSVWPNIGPNRESARNATQATDANRPVYTAKDPDFAGHGSLTFSPTKWLATLAFSSPITQPCTYYIVYSASTDATMVDGLTGSNRNAIYLNGGRRLVAYAGASLWSTPSNSKGVCCVIFKGSSSYLYANSLTPNIGDAGTNSAAGLVIGAAYTHEGVTGKLSYLIASQGADPSALAVRKLKYLSYKYKITLS